MKVVVTGGAGFIGSHVCAAFLGTPGVTEIVVIDDLSTGRRSNVDRASCRLIVGSVLDSALLDRGFRGADAVVHLAAVASVPARPGDVLDSCADIGRMRALFPSVEVKGLADGLSAMLANATTAPATVDRTHRIAVTEPMRRPTAETVSRDRVVIVTASVAGGHNGAACELGRRLVERGLSVTQLDLLDLIPWVGAAMTATYVAMLRWAPWTYQFTYTALNRVPVLTAVANFVTRTGRRRLLRAIPADTVMVVATYPMASQLLGWLRRGQRLTVPAATFLTDFSVHRLWVAKGVDTHLALHEVPAGQASRLGAANVIVGGSLVGPAFRPLAPQERAGVRRQFGLPVEERLALLVGGSWGVGDIGRAVREVARTGLAVPVVVCGQNAALRRRLQADGIQYCLGWVEEMPRLIGAVDVLVQNAGGLTSLESFAAGVPVLSYRSIPGHGRSNAAALHEAGLALSVERESDLAAGLNELLDGPRGLRQRAAGLQLGELDPVEVISDVVQQPGLVPQQRRATRPRVGRRLIAVASVLATLIWMGTDGTRLAVAHGLNSAEPAHEQGVYIVVHPSADLDPQTITMMATLQVGAAIDAGLIQRQPDTVRRLLAGGVVLLNSGRGRPYHTGLISGRLAIRRTAEAIAHVDGHIPRLFVTGSDLDAIDLGVVAAIHERIIVPDEWSSDGAVPELRPGDVAMLECTDDVTCQAELALLQRRALRLGLPLRPISELIR